MLVAPQVDSVGKFATFDHVFPGPDGLGCVVVSGLQMIWVLGPPQPGPGFTRAACQGRARGQGVTEMTIFSTAHALPRAQKESLSSPELAANTSQIGRFQCIL